MANAKAYRLLDALRSQSRARIAGCRKRRIAKTVQVQHQQDGSIGYSGILSCGSVWSCPVCATRVCMHRGNEVKTAVERWKAMSPTNIVSMLTLTVRHARGHKLGELRRGLARAWRAVWQGKVGAKRKQRFHVAHSIRALEVTHSEANGWHPHFHIALFQTAEATPEALDDLRALWIRLVEKELGASCAPDWEHGVNLKPMNLEKYLTKLGLEVSSVTKEGRREASRSPWEIAHAAAAGDKRAQYLWKEYSESMRGARQLFWSHNARGFFGLKRDESDYEAAKDQPGYVLGEWDAETWDANCKADRFWVSRVVAAATSTLPASEVSRLPGVRFLNTPGVSGGQGYEWPLRPADESSGAPREGLGLGHLSETSGRVSWSARFAWPVPAPIRWDSGICERAGASRCNAGRNAVTLEAGAVCVVQTQHAGGREAEHESVTLPTTFAARTSGRGDAAANALIASEATPLAR